MYYSVLLTWMETTFGGEAYQTVPSSTDSRRSIEEIEEIGNSPQIWSWTVVINVNWGSSFWLTCKSAWVHTRASSANLSICSMESLIAPMSIKCQIGHTAQLGFVLLHWWSSNLLGNQWGEHFFLNRLNQCCWSVHAGNLVHDWLAHKSWHVNWVCLRPSHTLLHILPTPVVHRLWS